jgi:hypothetical protein
MSTAQNPKDDPDLKNIAADISNKLISLGEDEEAAIKFSFDVLERIVNTTRTAMREGSLSATDDPLRSAVQ